MEEKYVQCKTHGKSEYGFVCQHLIEGEEVGFYEVPVGKNEPHTWIWCETCDDVIVKTDGDEKEISNVAQWKLICISCISAIKKKNAFLFYVK